MYTGLWNSTHFFLTHFFLDMTCHSYDVYHVTLSLSWLSAMGWLRSVGSIKLYVSFAEYCLCCRAILQQRPIILSILAAKATPYLISLSWPSVSTSVIPGTAQKTRTSTNTRGKKKQSQMQILSIFLKWCRKAQLKLKICKNMTTKNMQQVNDGVWAPPVRCAFFFFFGGVVVCCCYCCFC